MSKTLVVKDIKLPIEAGDDELLYELRRRGVHADLSAFRILKKSLDARDKSALRYIYTIATDEYAASGRLGKGCEIRQIAEYKVPESGAADLNSRPVIVGAGPAGLFAGLILAQAGYRPLIIERGQSVEDRSKTVAAHQAGEALSPESNVCYGEGGAGTFSDGKLTTGIKDDYGRERFVLDTFADNGADESIKYWYRPHIGSDVLPKVIKNLRKKIQLAGGTFLFDTKLVGLDVQNGHIAGIQVSGKDGIDTIQTECLILATGHSAQDTYKLVYNSGAEMTSKPFAVGFRIQHPQDMIQLAQYGTSDRTYLPVADYKLTANVGGRGVYTFCMCPGGYIVDSSTEDEHLCINGMSYSGRDGSNANSAVIAQVNHDDYGDGLFAGLDFQKEIERRAWQVAGGHIPVQTLGDFALGRAGDKLGEVSPQICGEYAFGDLSNILPPAINQAITGAITSFGGHINGFDRSDALLAAVESRTSSPIRICRNEHFESNVSGLFPCGEGAGYAGGIMSAAIDGMKVAEEIIRRYKSV